MGNHSGLTPVKPPTLFTTTFIGVEPNFKFVRLADNLIAPVILRLSPSIEDCKRSAKFVGNCYGVIFCFNLIGCEANLDPVALRNLYTLDNVMVVEISLGA